LKTPKNNGDGKRFPKAATSEFHYRNLVENALVGMLDTTLDGKIIFANRAALKMVGIDSLDELKKKNASIFWLRPERRNDLISDLKQNGFVNDYEIDLLTTTGKIITLLSSATLHDNVISNMVIDITARKEEEHSLLANHENSIRAAEIAGMGFLNWNLKTNAITLSKEACKVFGIPKEPLPNRNQVLGLVHPDDREFVIKSFEMAIEGRGKYDIDHRIIQPEGSVIWVHGRGDVDYDKDGEPLSMMGTVIDITTRKKTADKLFVSGEIIAKMTEAVYVLRAVDLSIVFTNPAFDKLFGYQPNELIGEHISIVNAPIDKKAEEISREISEILEKTGNWQGEILNLRKDGSTFWCNANINGFNHPEYGKAWVAVYADITEKKKTEEIKTILLHDAVGRLKELECLYTISDSVRTKDSLDEIFQDTVLALPPGCQYPDIARCKLHYKDNEWISEAFEETEWKLSSDIMVAGKHCGNVEIYYLELCPTLDEGPFMAEERKLIDMIARMIGDAIERYIAEGLLRENEARLRLFFESAPIMIDAFDADGRCTMWNKECEKVFGYTAEEMFAQENPLALFYPDPEMQKQVIESIMHNPDNEFLEWHPLRKDGTETTCLWANFQLPDGNIISLGQDITKRRQADQELQRYQQRLKSLAVQLTIAEEQERRRIAAELHDHVGQSLALTRLQLAAVSKNLPFSEEQQAQVEDISQSLLEAIKDTRQLIFDLSSPSLNEIGLAAAIAEWSDQKIAKKHGLQIEVVDHAPELQLDTDLRALLFRTVRELLANVLKHSRAKFVSTTLEATANQLTITIQDDGVGFDTEFTMQRGRSNGGFGLFSIQERMSDLGGKFEIVSRPGNGCVTTLLVPIQGQTTDG